GRPHLDDQIQIPRRRTLGSGIALTRQPNPLPIPRPRLDVELQRLPPRHHTRTFARRASILHLAASPAPRALDVELHPPAHLRHLSAPMALRTLHAPAQHGLPLAR